MKKKLTVEGFIQSLLKQIQKITSNDLNKIMRLQDPRLKKSILRLKTDKDYYEKMAKKYGVPPAR